MSSTITRRRFVSSTAAAAMAFTIVKPQHVRGTQANSRIKLGLIGCGVRGKWIANFCREHGGFQLTALADYFPDRAGAAAELFNIPANRQYHYLSGYEHLLQTDVEAVLIETPSYFHPAQAAAAIAAGKHVYLAKPVAVDVPGCRIIEAAGHKATADHLVFLVDFQTRANEHFIGAVEAIHRGDIGKIAFGEASYHDDALQTQAEPGTPEARLKNWAFDIALSGDIITEQNIHTLDVMSWIMNQPPVHAEGTGGRTVRTHVGDCYDHFTLVFQYPDNVGISFSSRQFRGHGTPGGIQNRVFGTEGALDATYGGTVVIRGEKPFRGGRTSDIYQSGAQNNIATFHRSITQQDYANPTVAPSVQSNLVTILGRTAAYQNRRVTWNELLQSSEPLQPDLTGLRA